MFRGIPLESNATTRDLALSARGHLNIGSGDGHKKVKLEQVEVVAKNLLYALRREWEPIIIKCGCQLVGPTEIWVGNEENISKANREIAPYRNKPAQIAAIVQIVLEKKLTKRS